MGYHRTIDELFECLHYGKLYRIQKVCGGKYLCVRCKRSGKNLYLTSERITLINDKPKDRLPCPGDFAFVSTDGCWSHFAVTIKTEGTHAEEG